MKISLPPYMCTPTLCENLPAPLFPRLHSCRSGAALAARETGVHGEIFVTKEDFSREDKRPLGDP